MSEASPSLAPLEVELLQEIMNIAFGQAAADLADVVDLFIVLSVPQVELMPVQDLSALLKGAAQGQPLISLMEQAFWGNFSGSGYLVLPAEASRSLISILGNGGGPEAGLPLEELERETLLEVGNILVGACVGKLAELLEDGVTYSPPIALLNISPEDPPNLGLISPDSTAIVLKTVFRFSGRDVAGKIFLVTSQASIAWIKKALADFMGRYA